MNTNLHRVALYLGMLAAAVVILDFVLRRLAPVR